LEGGKESEQRCGSRGKVGGREGRKEERMKEKQEGRNGLR
jgi:hypothetical protein